MADDRMPVSLPRLLSFTSVVVLGLLELLAEGVAGLGCLLPSVLVV